MTAATWWRALPLRHRVALVAGVALVVVLAIVGAWRVLGLLLGGGLGRTAIRRTRVAPPLVEGQAAQLGDAAAELAGELEQAQAEDAAADARVLEALDTQPTPPTPGRRPRSRYLARLRGERDAK